MASELQRTPRSLLPPEELEKQRKYHREYARKHREERIAYQREYRKLFPERSKASSDKWRKNNPEKARERDRRSKKRNRQKINQRALARQKAFPERSRQVSAARRAQKKNLTPSSANPKIIKVFYETAARLTKIFGFPWHVDHIVPLEKQGKHHHANLAVITASLNCRKQARSLTEVLAMPEFQKTILSGIY